MNTTLKNNVTELQDKLNAWRSAKTDEDLIIEEEYTLMANYLSEIERLHQNIKRKELATMIGTSPSYLTQVFRGDKPLNFHTVAKIQRALKIKFHVKAVLESAPYYTTEINNAHNNVNNWSQGNKNVSPRKEVSFFLGGASLYNEKKVV